ncbi:hypothetical protein [Bacillus pseudomycoides]|uniref:hypothetical protein n=1 Tax=Bacillus pseudomycoides TaxID=64104 RepID=UPI00032EA8D3|nr:hypothetical protein KOY_05277 [Bacillus cereus VDM021]
MQIAFVLHSNNLYVKNEMTGLLAILLVKENREMEKVKYIYQQQETKVFVDCLFSSILTELSSLCKVIR